MIRIDMSEYMEKYSVSRLIGAAPGYVGFEEGGQLTEAVRRRPYSVILFDEIEKAHRDVFNLFLQILDDGQLTDSHGRTVSFKNTIIIMTSNLGSQLLLEHSQNGQTPDVDSLKPAMMQLLKQEFRPEFLNRVDGILLFQALQQEQIAKIFNIQFEKFKDLLEERHISVFISGDAQKLLVEKGYDPQFGARPMKRVFVQDIETPVSRLLISGELHEGSTLNIEKDPADQKLIFHCNEM